MKIKTITYNLFIGLMVFLVACQTSNSEKGFQVTDSGLRYKFVTDNKDGKDVQADHFVDYKIAHRDHKDSLLGEQSGMVPFPPDSIKGNSTFESRLLEALRMMSEGDSAVFQLSMDSLIAEQTKAFEDKIEQKKQEMAARLTTAEGDSAKQNIERSYNADIQQLEQQKNTPNPFLIPGEFLSFAIKVDGVKKKEEIQKYEQEKIDKYLKDNNLKAQTTESGLNYIIKKEGTGAIPKNGDTVNVNYEGRLLSGQLFDTSKEDLAKENNIFNPGRPYAPYRFTLGNREVIPGWDEAIALIKEGTVATLFIPSHLAYGPRGSGRSIPPFATLMFEVELTKVEAASSEKSDSPKSDQSN